MSQNSKEPANTPDDSANSSESDGLTQSQKAGSAPTRSNGDPVRILLGDKVLIGERHKLISAGWGPPSRFTYVQMVDLYAKADARGRGLTDEDVDHFEKTGQLPD